MSQIHRIGILSDTHIKTLSPHLIELFKTTLGDCPRLLHAGDVVHPSVLEELEAHGWEVVAVRGNMDLHPGLGTLPHSRLVKVGELQLGLCHGGGSPTRILDRVFEQFLPSPPPLIVYGHTHEAADCLHRGVRFINPGSPTEKRWADHHTVGRLTVEGAEAHFEVVCL